MSSFSARRSGGRGSSASRYSDKSDNTLLTPLIEDSSSYTSDSDSSDDGSTSAASYGGVPDEKPSAFQLVKLGVGEYSGQKNLYIGWHLLKFSHHYYIICFPSSLAVNVVLVGGIAACVASFLPSVMLLSPAIMVYVAGGITIANAPYAAFKEVRITKLPSLRSLNNKLREEATRLEKEVDALSEEIDAISPEAERAGAVEEELREIADRQQFNVDRLIDLVNENEDILDQMRDNLRQKITQDIIRIVIKSDVDNDQKFCKVESKMLALKIRIQLQEYGVEFDEMKVSDISSKRRTFSRPSRFLNILLLVLACLNSKFYKVINSDPTIGTVLKIVEKLVPNIGQDDESASEDEDEDRESYDMFRLVSDKSIKTTGGSIQDIPEERRASSALGRGSSWRSALGTSSGGHIDESSMEHMSGARLATLALTSVPSRRRNRRKSSTRRSSLIR